MNGRRGSDADTTVEDENPQAYVPKGEKEAEDDHLAPAYGAKMLRLRRVLTVIQALVVHYHPLPTRRSDVWTSGEHVQHLRLDRQLANHCQPQHDSR